MSRLEVLLPGADPGGVDWVASPPPSLGSFKLEIMKGNRTIIEVILSLNILISFCQVSHPPFKNPGSATAYNSSGPRNPYTLADLDCASGYGLLLVDLELLIKARIKKKGS